MCPGHKRGAERPQFSRSGREFELHTIAAFPIRVSAPQFRHRDPQDVGVLLPCYSFLFAARPIRYFSWIIHAFVGIKFQLRFAVREQPICSSLFVRRTQTLRCPFQTAVNAQPTLWCRIEQEE